MKIRLGTDLRRLWPGMTKGFNRWMFNRQLLIVYANLTRSHPSFTGSEIKDKR
ncbi:hypothetical protein [Paenibacillus sp. 32O-W]|uniref:hypothetical protein n=1 Tax=Paenibacillus sp. 32O-W TaxID=1695218 RepID=UPI0016425F1E|nr:hypothetical protein [Paenibacillus sp. 32O-W]